MLNKKKIHWKKNKYSKLGLCAGITGATALLLLVVYMVCSLLGAKREEERVREADQMLAELNLSVNLLDINKYSRPGTKLRKVKGVVVHYTANPGTDAMANRNYFNNLPKINAKKGTNTYASSHFVIGIDGTIVQCIPTEEIAYASNDRNSDTISIECCHKKKSGKFTKETYRSLIRLTKYLCIRFGLEVKDVIRHYDVTGKNCPRYFVEHPDAWTRFLADMEAELAQ